MSQVTEITEILEGLGDDATIDEVLFATRGYYQRDVMAAMYAYALAHVGLVVDGSLVTFTYGGIQA